RDVQFIELPVHSKAFSARGSRAFSRLLRGIPPLVDRFAGFEAQVAEILAGKSYDLGVVEHFWCAPYQEVLAPPCRPLVLPLQNIESEPPRRSWKGERGLVSLAHWRFAALAEEMESQWLPRYRELLAASECDAETARRVACEAAVHVVPNAIPSMLQP